MWNKEAFKERMKNIGLDVSFWGRHGKEVLNELEQKLNFQFDPDTRSFIEEIGNLDLGGSDIIIAGNSEGTSNCIIATKNIGLLDDGDPEGVKIMDSSGLSYVVYEDGSIKAYEHHYVKPDGVIESYNSLSDLVEYIIKIEIELIDE